MDKPTIKRRLAITTVHRSMNLINYDIDPLYPNVDSEFLEFGDIDNREKCSRSLRVSACCDFDEVLSWIKHKFSDDDDTTGEVVQLIHGKKITATFKIGSQTWYGTENGRLYAVYDNFPDGKVDFHDLSSKPITMIHFTNTERGIASDGDVYFYTRSGGQYWVTVD